MTNKVRDKTPGDISSEYKETGYKVLARKYRPMDFSGLIGQGAMVRTLANAFDTGRLAHAFILAGVRGVGKTTTARIIAKALNCIGKNGDGGSTINPCNQCEVCKAISEDRNLDVYEMDAASRTGVDDIRELIEGVRYKPVSNRYKVYIIDEVHMLSRNAFNALLKTLEEPPEHVKFIFATTEIRKVPVTVLSRCQRFDMRRVNTEALSKHFSEIAELENAEISEQSLSLIARVSDGSVRDGQSLLDQIITTSRREHRKIEENDVREILGLADRERSFDLLEEVLEGKVEKALETVHQDYKNGSEPISILQDLLELVHWITRAKISPGALEDLSNPESERKRGKILANKISMVDLSRAWQMLIKGLQEVQSAPTPIQALEMILIRLAFLSDLPSPADIVANFKNDVINSSEKVAVPNKDGQLIDPGSLTKSLNGGELELKPKSKPTPGIKLDTFEQLIDVLEDHDELILKSDLVKNVHLVSFETGKIEIRLGEAANPDTPMQLYSFLNSVAEERWTVSLATEGVSSTLNDQRGLEEKTLRTEVMKSPLIQSVIETFPGAEIENIRQLNEMSEILPEKELYKGENKE